MQLTSIIAIYFILWWLVFFAVLPFGIRTQEEDEEVIAGSPSSAPSKPRLMLKALLTTVISAAIFFALYMAVTVGGLTLDDIPFLPDATPEGWKPNYETSSTAG